MRGQPGTKQALQIDALDGNITVTCYYNGKLMM